MDYRLGTCSKCGENYKIPADFEHDVARCKECSGVVNIGPVQSDEAPAAAPPSPSMPAKKVAPKRAAAPAPAKAAEKPPENPPGKPIEVQAKDADKKRAERGTLAKLKAQRAAAAKAEGASPKPAAPAGPKPAAKAPGAAKRPAAPAAAGAAAPARPRAGGARRSKGGGGRRSSGSRAPREREKKGLPVGGLIGIVAIVLLAVGGFLFKDSLFGGGEPTDATNEVAAKEPEVSDDAAPADEVEDEAAPAEDGASDEAPAEDAAAKEPEKKEPERTPESVDLTKIADFGKARGTTDEEWSEMQELMATWMDLDAGAAGPRAGRALAEYGRKAMPVILNYWKHFDFGTPEGIRKGDMVQKQLKDICNGNNFGWRYEGDKNHVYFNKKVVEAWATSWGQVETSIVAWINLAKLEEKDPKLARELMAQYGDAPEEDDFGGDSDDLDDLGVD